MRAYKGFNKDLTCTMGKGKFQYEVGQTYKEDKAECVSTGFHCVEEPIDVLNWYSNEDSRYCIVEAAGDIHEDGNRKIACTEMTILKEVTIEQIAALECEWVRQHPNRKCSEWVKKRTAIATKRGVCIARGKNPAASGQIGATIFLLKEGKGTNEIEEAACYRIDGETFKPNKFYNVEGKEVRKK